MVKVQGLSLAYCVTSHGRAYIAILEPQGFDRDRGFSMALGLPPVQLTLVDAEGSLRTHHRDRRKGSNDSADKKHSWETIHERSDRANRMWSARCPVFGRTVGRTGSLGRIPCNGASCFVTIVTCVRVNSSHNTSTATRSRWWDRHHKVI